MKKHRRCWSKTRAIRTTSMATVMALRAKTCPEHFEQGRASLRSKDGGGGSQKLAVALLGVHTLSKNPRPVSEHKHTSLSCLAGKSSEVRSSRTEKRSS